MVKGIHTVSLFRQAASTVLIICNVLSVMVKFYKFIHVEGSRYAIEFENYSSELLVPQASHAFVYLKNFL